MIMAVLPRAPLYGLKSNYFLHHRLLSSSTRESAIVGQRNEHVAELMQSGADAALGQLFHMTLSSLREYQELRRLASEFVLADILDVIVRQRTAQCHALAELSDGLIPPELVAERIEVAAQADSGAANLQLIWLRTVWSYEQQEYSQFGDNLDAAEMLLEDAFLKAAQTYRDTPMATVFQECAVTICGARQCMEETIATLIAESTSVGDR